MGGDRDERGYVVGIAMQGIDHSEGKRREAGSCVLTRTGCDISNRSNHLLLLLCAVRPTDCAIRPTDCAINHREKGQGTSPIINTYKFRFLREGATLAVCCTSYDVSWSDLVIPVTC